MVSYAEYAKQYFGSEGGRTQRADQIVNVEFEPGGKQYAYRDPRGTKRTGETTNVLVTNPFSKNIHEVKNRKIVSTTGQQTEKAKGIESNLASKGVPYIKSLQYRSGL